MEAGLLLINSILMVVLAYLSVRDERRGVGTPPTSLFRPVDDTAVRPQEAAEQARLERIARSRAR